MLYPIKMSFKTEVLPAAMLIAAWIFGFYFYAHFPDQVATHWNFAGDADKYGSKASGAFAIPGVITGIYFLFLVLPFLDPKKERYAEFAGIYHFFKAAIMFVLFGTFIAASLANLGYAVRINVVVPLLIGVLFVAMGNFMAKIKSNWFVGIKTPWTLSSENVWTKTNRFGGFAMVVFGLMLIVSPLLPKVWSMIFLFTGVAVVSVGSFIYSYVAYKKERRAVEKLIVK